jgi:Fe-S cluster assembly protein SufD
LHLFREEATKLLSFRKSPTKQDEEWRYSDLSLLEHKSCNKKNLDTKFDQAMLDQDSYHVVFINAVLDQSTLNLPEESVVLHEASGEIFLKEIEKINLQKDFDNKYQVLQNHSKAPSGVLIEVIKNLDKPLKIYYLNSGEVHQNIFVKIKKSTNVTLHENFLHAEGEKFFTNHVTKIELEEDSSCKHFKNTTRHCEEGDRGFYSSKIICKKSSHYSNYVLNLGSASCRQDIECELVGEHSSCKFYGVNIGKDSEKYDVVLKVNHKASNSYSMQHYNQVLSNNSKGSFYSKIEIPVGLHKIEAHQLNKNLLLNEKAQSFSRPELDIHSDDVICSHGATVGNVDEDALQYLKSRGIKEKDAEKLILEAFVKSVFKDKGLSDAEYEDFIFQLMNHL